MRVPKLKYVHPRLTKQYENCFRVAITYPNVFLLYMSVENGLPVLFLSFVETLLSTAFHQKLAFALKRFVTVEKYQVNFSLSEDNQLKPIP